MGIEHLLGLKEILVIIRGYGANGSSTRAALSALRKAIDTRSSRPTANIMCVDNSLFRGRLDDGFSWKKYGQKDILGTKHPRGYFRCSRRESEGCRATKEVQRTDDCDEIFDFEYKGKHTCTPSEQEQTIQPRNDLPVLWAP
ncbi:hypothetical protein ZWY2020_031470 [Hordeum vulgare]|nr:hypothetical protein ZWY2020_031470 [Hordeum vulgare]